MDSIALQPLRRASQAWAPRQRSSNLRPAPSPEPIAWPEPVVLPRDFVYMPRDEYIPLAQKMPTIRGFAWGKQAQRRPPDIVVPPRPPSPEAEPLPPLVPTIVVESPTPSPQLHNGLRPLVLPARVAARHAQGRAPLSDRLQMATRTPAAPPPLPDPPPPLPPVPSRMATTYPIRSPRFGRFQERPVIGERSASLPKPPQPWVTFDGAKSTSDLPYLQTPPGSPRRKPVPQLLPHELDDGPVGVAL